MHTYITHDYLIHVVLHEGIEDRRNALPDSGFLLKQKLSRSRRTHQLVKWSWHLSTYLKLSMCLFHISHVESVETVWNLQPKPSHPFCLLQHAHNGGVQVDYHISFTHHQQSHLMVGNKQYTTAAATEQWCIPNIKTCPRILIILRIQIYDESFKFSTLWTDLAFWHKYSREWFFFCSFVQNFGWRAFLN